MNELDLTNTQAVISMVVLIGFLLYLNHRDRKKSAQFERERMELEKQRDDNWDLISRPEVLEKLGISGTTLNNWQDHGLKSFQSPFENSKKIYYRKSDIYNFLAVD